MNKILNQVLDFPSMINSKLPMNNFNSMVDDSENNVAKWTGMAYNVSALLVLLTSLLAILSPIWSGGMGEGLGVIGNVIAMLIWAYAAFPIAQMVRATGDGLADSKSGIVSFIFRDLALANIKLVGKIAALSAFFGALCMTLSWATSINVSGGFMMDWIDNIAYFTSLPMAAVAVLANTMGLGFVSNILANDWANWDPTMAAGAAWSPNGFVALLWEYVGVLVILAKMFVNLAIYSFFYGIISSLVRWIQSPYIPIKTS